MKADVYGLIGKELSYSLSPLIHSVIMKHADIKGCYNIFEIRPEDIKAAADGLRAISAKGVNVTIPYKTDIMQHIDDVSESAQAIGAVNTLHIKDRKITGYNTDYDGFRMNLDMANIRIEGKSFTLLGSGGAAKAVLKVLTDNKASSISIVARDISKIEERFRAHKKYTYYQTDEITDLHCLINCTPVGTWPDTDRCPVEESFIKRFENAVDLIYNPAKTKLLKICEENGMNHMNGLYMLIGQAIRAQEIWNDITIDQSVRTQIFSEIIESLKLH